MRRERRPKKAELRAPEDAYFSHVPTPCSQHADQAGLFRPSINQRFSITIAPMRLWSSDQTNLMLPSPAERT